jgi:Zn-dependent protease with chaperone function
MPARTDMKKWLQQMRKSGTAMTQGALWLGGILGGFLLPPPAGISTGEEKMWLRLGQFIIAIILGLVFFAVQRWSQPKHAFKWCGVGVLFLFLAIGAFFRYQQIRIAWTENYNGENIVIGSVLTPQGRSALDENPKISGNDLLANFAGATENIWTRESINNRRLVLAATYISCLPLFTICLIAVVQAIQCGSTLRKRRKSSISTARKPKA